MRLSPLTPDFGYEVHDLDLGSSISNADADALQAAFAKGHMLLLRNQQALSDAGHADFASLFGPVTEEYLDGSKVAWVTNRPNTKTTVPGEAGLHWHSDYSFTEWPLRGISLQAMELSGKSAATRFASTARAWAALPQALQAELEPLEVLHLADFSGASAELGVPTDRFDDEPDQELYPHKWHPLKMPHPRTGEPLLFANEFLSIRLGGVPREKSRALLQAIWPILYDPAHVYEHDWREGDLLIWDNFALQHGRDDFTPEPGEPSPVRVLRRVSLGADYERMVQSVPRLAGALAAM